MWNKRPEEELPRSFDPSAAGTAQAGELSNPNEVKTKPTLTTSAGKTESDSSSKCTATIGKGVKIVGEIYSSNDLFIEGFVQGTVEALDQKLTIGPNGVLYANVQVRELDVQGTVQGNVECCERIDIRKGATLVGDIKAARIVLEDGAYFKGKIDIVRPEPEVNQQAA
jgi:cytoskeletal protein CcmA (bactofilin family)